MMIGEAGQGSYYRGALAALRFVEARLPTKRRFGPDADALWGSFKGELGASSRIDLLLRDADAQWPAAFGARAVYNLRSTAEDEPFGPGWEPMTDVLAEELWRGLANEPVPETVADAIAAIAAAWELPLESLEPPTIGPTDAFIVAGPSAIAALINGFAAGSDLDWSKQVMVIATPPAHRQLAAAGAALVSAREATQLFAAGEATEGLGAAELFVSDDATDDDRSRATALQEG